MKINWKVLIVLVLMTGITAWLVNALRTQHYTGTVLNVGIGSGPVTLINSGNEPVAVQLTGTGVRGFTVASPTAGLAGTSTRQGTGSSSTQVFNFTAPSGMTTFTVGRGTGVMLGVHATSPLTVSADPLNANEARTTGLVALAVLLAGLFYLYRTLAHDRQTAERQQALSERPTQPMSEVRAAHMGRDGRAYSDS